MRAASRREQKATKYVRRIRKDSQRPVISLSVGSEEKRESARLALNSTGSLPFQKY